MGLAENIEKNKENQVKLREIQQKRDRNVTFGHEFKDPCKNVGFKF